MPKLSEDAKKTKREFLLSILDFSARSGGGNIKIPEQYADLISPKDIGH